MIIVLILLSLLTAVPAAHATRDVQTREVDQGDVRGSDRAGGSGRFGGGADGFSGALFGGGMAGPKTPPAQTTVTERFWTDGATGKRWKVTTTRRPDGTYTEREEPADVDKEKTPYLYFYKETDYDADGRAVAGRGGNASGEAWSREYQYEEGGRVRTITNYSDGKSIVDVKVDGKTTRTLFKENGKLVYRTDYTYDKKGKLKRVEQRDYKKRTVTIYQYDAEGNVDATVENMDTGERIQPGR